MIVWDDKARKHIADAAGGLAEALQSDVIRPFVGRMADLPSANESNSPIETLMGMSLFYLMESPSWYKTDHSLNLFLHANQHSVSEIKARTDFPDWDFISVYHQMPVGPYQADFFLEVGMRMIFKGQPWRHEVVHAVIECDGHDYHERTKEQAQHDKSRDRFFQEEGIIVLRYTGSEIWNAPLKAASSALEALQKILRNRCEKRYVEALTIKVE